MNLTCHEKVPGPLGYISLYSSYLVFPLNDINHTFSLIFKCRVCIDGVNVHSCQNFHSLHLCVVTSLLGCIVRKYLILYPEVTVYPVWCRVRLWIRPHGIYLKNLHLWRYRRMYYQLWTCYLKIVCPCITCNLVDIASAPENMFCTTVSFASGII